MTTLYRIVKTTELTISTFYTCAIEDSPSTLEKWGNTCLLPMRRVITLGGRKVTLNENTYKISPRQEKSYLTKILKHLFEIRDQEGRGASLVIITLLFFMTLSVFVGFFLKLAGLTINSEARRRNWKLIQMRYQEEMRFIDKPAHKAAFENQIASTPIVENREAGIYLLPYELREMIIAVLTIQARGRMQQVSRSWYIISNDSWRVYTKEQKIEHINKYIPQEIVSQIGMQALLKLPREKLKAHKISDSSSDYAIQPIGSRRIEGELEAFKRQTHPPGLYLEHGPKVLRDSFEPQKKGRSSIYWGVDPIFFIRINVLYREASSPWLQRIWSWLKFYDLIETEYKERKGFVVLHPLKGSLRGKSYWGLSRSWNDYVDVIPMQERHDVEQGFQIKRKSTFIPQAFYKKEIAFQQFLKLWQNKGVGLEGGLQGPTTMPDGITPCLENWNDER